MVGIAPEIINGKFILLVELNVQCEVVGQNLQSKAMNLSEEDVQAVYGSDIACMAKQFNILLKGNPLAAKYLPLTEVSIYQRSYEGVLLCAMANLIHANSVDEKSVVVSPELLDDSPAGEFRKMENRNLGITTLRGLGVSIDKNEANYIRKDTPFRMTGLLVQVLRLATLGRMHFAYFEQLVHLFDGWSDPVEASDILATDREKMLRRWVNYQLKKAGTDLELKDFGEGLADSKVYSILLWTVAPESKRDSLTKSDDVMKQTDLLKRAELVIANAAKLGLADSIRPEHISNAGKQKVTCSKGLHNNLLNVVFIYNIFVAYPNIDVPMMKNNDKPAAKAAETPAQMFKSLYKYGASEDTLIRWLNSFGPSPLVVSLKTDLRNGSILLQVWDAMYPGCVNWSKVRLESFTNPAMRKFVLFSNCEVVTDCANKFGIPKHCITPSDIAEGGENNNVLSMVFIMMLMHAQLIRKEIISTAKVPDLAESELVKWINNKMGSYGSSFQLKNLDDPGLKKTNALGFLGERILVENNMCSSGPSDFPRKTPGSANGGGKPKPPPVPPKPKMPTKMAKSGNAVDAAEDDAADIANDAMLADSHNSAKWQFSSVQPVSDLAQQVTFSVTAILMFNKAGVIVYASKLGPDTEVAVYRSVLLELNALSLKVD